MHIRSKLFEKIHISAKLAFNIFWPLPPNICCPEFNNNVTRLSVGWNDFQMITDCKFVDIFILLLCFLQKKLSRRWICCFLVIENEGGYGSSPSHPETHAHPRIFLFHKSWVKTWYIRVVNLVLLKNMNLTWNKYLQKKCDYFCTRLYTWSWLDVTVK